jgi:uncharacterized protein YukE
MFFLPNCSGFMGFFDKLFGKKEEKIEAKKEEITINFDEVPSFLEGHYKKEFDEASKEIFSRFSEIKHSVKELELQLNELEKEKIEENQGHKKLRKIVSTSKKTLIEKMRGLNAKLIPPNSADFIELNSYCNNSIKLLESEINVFGKNIAYTGILLKEQMKELGKKINELNSVFSRTKELFDSKKNLLGISEIKSNFQELKEKAESKKESLLLEKELSARISSTETELGEKTKSLKELQDSIQAKQLEILLKEKSSLLEKKQEIKNNLTELFFPVEKLLRVFRKMAEAKKFPLNEDERSLLTSYLSDPFLALKKDNKAETLKKIFNYIKELVLKSEISLKEKEKEKKLSVLDGLIAFDFFGEFFWELNELEKKLIEVEARVNSLDISKEISSLESEISSLGNSAKSLSIELEKQKKHSQEISQQLLKLKNSLEESLTDFSGKKVELFLKG